MDLGSPDIEWVGGWQVHRRVVAVAAPDGPIEESNMRLVGYSDRWSAKAGDTLRFYVSSEYPHYDARLVRLVHGDLNPHGPGFKKIDLPADFNGRYKGLSQPIYTGSYVRADVGRELVEGRGFTILVWLQATAVQAGEQGLVTQWDVESGRGFGLFINAATGTLEGRIRLQNGISISVCSERPLRQAEWYFAALSYDPIGRTIVLRTDPCRPTAFDAPREIISATVEAPAVGAPGVPVLLGAGSLRKGAVTHAIHCYNGKLSSPALLARALTAGEVRNTAPDDLLSRVGEECAARWDFSHDPSGRRIPDVSGNGFDGYTVNRPTRAVTGHNWRARTDSFLEAPSEYNAIHFHDDDLEDARWTESFQFLVPSDLRSGVYAVHLSAADNASDYIPFFVRPPVGKTTASIAVLIPTLSYMAYSNDALNLEDLEFLAPLCPLRNMGLQPEEFDYIESNSMKSTYDLHRDGSGICHATILRPSLTTMRPTHRDRLFDGAHQLCADLHLIDWLETKQFAYDVITDHDLHQEGAALLNRYRTVLTGTHAEYWTLEMLDALEAYQQQGGRFVYLSGNGLYWVTALDPESQTVCEVRRTNGTRAWVAQPGEGRMSFTGQPGGTWALRGRAPQRYVGVGFASQGFDRGVPYRRSDASHDPRCAFIFEGVSGELIGNTPALILNHGAAGMEVDRVDYGRGTPPHALIVASSVRLSDSYQIAIEDLPLTAPNQGGLMNSNVRADMVFYETPNNGAVFSVGSISFCSTLSYNDYENDVSRLLENVVRAFASSGPLPGRRPEKAAP
jgi:N,N-dimethylformamidase